MVDSPVFRLNIVFVELVVMESSQELEGQVVLHGVLEKEVN